MYGTGRMPLSLVASVCAVATGVRGVDQFGFSLVLAAWGAGAQAGPGGGVTVAGSLQVGLQQQAAHILRGLRGLVLWDSVRVLGLMLRLVWIRC